MPHIHFPPLINIRFMNKKKTRTTYGVYNLIEWHAQLKMGKATVKVLFAGGSITASGVTPATYTTEDPVVQFAIESSPEFKSGKIKVVRRLTLKELIEVERNAVAMPEKPAEDTAKAAAPGPIEADEDTAVKEENEADGVNRSDGAEAVAMTQVEFSCNDDAKDYLEQTFGYIRSKLKNREDIVNAGKAHGVEIIFA